VTGSGLVLKRKRKTKKSQSQSKRSKFKHIFTEEEKEEMMECLKSGLDIFVKRSIRTSIVKSQYVTNLLHRRTTLHSMNLFALAIAITT
jgi:hypothetical protein